MSRHGQSYWQICFDTNRDHAPASGNGPYPWSDLPNEIGNATCSCGVVFGTSSGRRSVGDGFCGEGWHSGFGFGCDSCSDSDSARNPRRSGAA